MDEAERILLVSILQELKDRIIEIKIDIAALEVRVRYLEDSNG